LFLLFDYVISLYFLVDNIFLFIKFVKEYIRLLNLIDFGKNIHGYNIIISMCIVVMGVLKCK